MKFAIISDSHDNFANVAKALNWIKKQNIDLVLHCGDICRQETMDDMAKIFQGEIKFVRGNGDYDLEDMPLAMELLIDNKKIFLNHYPEVAKRMAKKGVFDLAFYGHTHKPWEEKIGKCRVINPGELAGQRFKATFAVYNTTDDSLELKILEKL